MGERETKPLDPRGKCEVCGAPTYGYGCVLPDAICQACRDYERRAIERDRMKRRAERFGSIW